MRGLGDHGQLGRRGDGRLRREEFDAVVSDIAMPFEDGFALIARLRGRGDIPAVALTGYVSEDDERRILAAGYNTYLSKPIAAYALGEAVAKLVQN
jgi:CheY-like chemotaxis protein